MSECANCADQVHYEGPVLVDNSGGDVCGFDGSNSPHQLDHVCWTDDSLCSECGGKS